MARHVPLLGLLFLALAGCEGEASVRAITPESGPEPLTCEAHAFGERIYEVCESFVDYDGAIELCEVRGASLAFAPGDAGEQSSQGNMARLLGGLDGNGFKMLWVGWPGWYDCPLIDARGASRPVGCNERARALCEVPW